MTQALEPAVEDGHPENFRERHRQQRRREFLDIALEIAANEGLGALTMQRITDEIGCANGSIYYYFGTKGTLIAELQLESLRMLAGSLQQSQQSLESRLDRPDVSPADAALARVVAAGRFWIDAETHFPREIEFCRRLFAEPGEVLDDDEAAPVVPPAMALLELAKGLLDDAVAHDALRPGANRERSVLLLAGTTGVMLTSPLRRWDSDLFDGHHLAATMLTDLLTAWGADSTRLARSNAIAADSP